MSLESAFIPLHQAPTVSIPFSRRVRLLQVVLPLCAPAATQAYYSAKPLSSAREFWTRFLSSCLLMEMGQWRFDKLNDEHDGLVRQALQCLDQTVVKEQIAVAEGFAHSPFPRLETLRQRVNKDTSGGESVLVGNLARPSTSEDRAQLLKTLDELANALKDDSRRPLPQAAPLVSKTQPLISPLLHNLFTTISKYCRCKCSRPHSAMLLLFSHVSTPKEHDAHCFTMFLSRRKRYNVWREMGFTVREQVPVPKVRIVLPDSAASSCKHDRSTEPFNTVTDLCETIETASTSRLNFTLDGTSLIKLASTDRELEKFESGEPISLAEGFLNHDTGLNFDGKLCLALVLSYSLLHYCSEHWFPRGWTNSGLHLVQDSDHLLLRPVLITNLNSSEDRSRSSRLTSELRFLLHGILLMEIFKQAPIMAASRFDEGMDYDHLRTLARQEFDAEEWGVHERFQQSVEACIDSSERVMSHNQEDHEQRSAKHFYQRVIGPLEMDFTSLWGDRDPDKVLSELKLPSIKRRGRPPLPKQKPLHLKSRSIKPSLPVTSKPHIVPRVQFFDCSHVLDQKQIHGATKWFDMFDQPHIHNQLPVRADKKERRIKIAILDTGIDLANPSISSKQGRIQCWPTREACKDEDGHGTQVAHLLLRLADHARLQIAKISKSRLLQDADVEGIAKAIEHFASDGEHRVDIINMSFGFPHFHERLRPILTAIRKARNNNVIIFAAAGNEGGNQGVSWPAKLHETSDVIRVNASDSDGNPSGFNPNVGLGHRICTLGEAVPSCEKDVSNCVIHRSGTSFATPIAAAIAAIVLGFVDNAESLNVPADFQSLKQRLRTRAGMERILTKTCVLQEEGRRDGYSYITPWFFLAIEEQDRVGIIANELRNLPE